jgi:hypothetical protein
MRLCASIIVLLLSLSGAQAQSSRVPSFGDEFWSHWGDGQAELCGYDLSYERYGKRRNGTCVTIFVTETFSDELRVKADPGQHPASDEYPVLKLNWVQDFPTGIYDYNLMTSSFVALTAREGRMAGSPTKISFSSQEWCGHVYQQLLFFGDEVELISHSYFDGEADQTQIIPTSAETIAEDALLHWARGLAFPLVGAGESFEARMVRGAQFVRMNHRPLHTVEVELTREASTTPVDGFGFARIARVNKAGEALWSFWVEEALPHRILRWESADGQRAELLASARLKYWELNGPGYEEALEKIGLRPREARMP